MPITHQSLLDAMDGIAMILDHKLFIIKIGEPNWVQFFEENRPQGVADRSLSEKGVLNRSVTQFIAGEVVRTTFANLFNSVLSGTRSVVRIEFRCDAPTLRREMRLSVRPITTSGDVRHLLYQSVLLSEQLRPAIPLFGLPVAEQGEEHILTLCAICARVAWPLGATTGPREWIESHEFYRRGGGDVVRISHGFCEHCFALLQEED